MADDINLNINVNDSGDDDPNDVTSPANSAGASGSGDSSTPQTPDGSTPSEEQNITSQLEAEELLKSIGIVQEVLDEFASSVDELQDFAEKFGITFEDLTKGLAKSINEAELEKTTLSNEDMVEAIKTKLAEIAQTNSGGAAPAIMAAGEVPPSEEAIQSKINEERATRPNTSEAVQGAKLQKEAKEQAVKKDSYAQQLWGSMKKEASPANLSRLFMASIFIGPVASALTKLSEAVISTIAKGFSTAAAAERTGGLSPAVLQAQQVAELEKIYEQQRISEESGDAIAENVALSASLNREFNALLQNIYDLFSELIGLFYILIEMLVIVVNAILWILSLMKDALEVLFKPAIDIFKGFVNWWLGKEEDKKPDGLAEQVDNFIEAELGKARKLQR